MYSKKQLWAHQRKRVHRFGSNDVFEMSVKYECYDSTRRSCSDPRMTTREKHPLAMSQKHSSSDGDTISEDLNNNHSGGNSGGNTNENDHNGNKSVKFGNSVKVVLIPTRQEYKQAELDSSIWYRKSELKRFKASAEEEIKSVMKGARLDVFHARTMLYQPLNTIIADWKRE